MPAIGQLVGNISIPAIDGSSQFSSIIDHIAAFFSSVWADFLYSLSVPAVHAGIVAWLITFSIIVFVVLSLGFGPAGVVAGSCAAAFQGMMYGAFTPAGGLFAMLTSLGMLGMLQPAVTIFAASIATIVAVIVGVWYIGMGGGMM